MDDAFSAFITTPSPATFLTLREQVQKAADYEFASDDVEALSARVGEKQYTEALEQFQSLMPGWLLSPRAHFLAAHAAEQIGEAERAEFERDFGRTCLASLRRSGDGTQARPYPVTHVADEYDLLAALKLTFASQRRVTGPDGVFDVLVCSNGAELWFDTTAGAVQAR